jgi:hypothetical protein
MNSNERGEFDFRKDVIYISQPVRCPLTVAAMREGIKLGWKAKDVGVSKSEDGSYTILDGNHRASAHFLEKKSLGYVVLLVERSSNHIYRSFRIEDEIIGGIEYERLFNSLIYLPREVAKSFCEENKQEAFFKALDEVSGQIEVCVW